MDKKSCLVCKNIMPINNFNKNKAKSDGLAPVCKKCRKSETKNYRRKSKDKLAYYQQLNKKRLKEAIISHYGNGTMECRKCKFDDLRALTIDHINGHGNEHRRNVGCRGNTFYRWLKKNDYPEDFQVLCMNCQFIKRHENGEHNQYKTSATVG